MNTRTKQSGSAERHLSPPELRLLLSNDDTSAPFRAAATHLETCATCQSELTALAGDSSWWKDTEFLLAAKTEPRWDPDLSLSSVSIPDAAADRQAINDHVLKLLGAPNHPEML